MKYQLLLLTAVIAIAVAEQCGSRCPDGSDSKKCDCCPEPCCCRCINKKGGEKPKPKICKQLLDLAVVLDSSGSISQTDWQVGKTFVMDILSILNNVGFDQRVAFVTYSTNATLQWKLDAFESTSLETLNEAVGNLPLIGEFTNTVEALELTVDQIFNGKDGDSPDRANFLLLITDGRSNFRLEDRQAVADKVHEVAHVSVIGITTQVDEQELKLFASSDVDVFTTSQFNDLSDRLLNEIAHNVCPTDVPPPKEECFCCCPPPPMYPYAHY